jgi:pimeloyl-ACP methyl ester carboxylesterase
VKINAGGVSIAYEEAGSGEPVVLLHGSGPGVSAQANWSRTLEGLAGKGYRAIAPDIVGFGESDRPEGFVYNARNWAGCIADFLAALDVGPVHLVGNSMGGRIALTLASMAPESLKSLTLMGVMSPAVPRSAVLSQVRAFWPSYEAMRDMLKESFVANPEVVTEELVRARYEASARPGEAEHYREMFATPEANAIPLSEDDIRAIQTRTLILHGREDRVVPVENGYSLARLVPNAVAVIISDCGHWVQMEHPELFEDQLGSFLSGYETRQ